MYEPEKGNDLILFEWRVTNMQQPQQSDKLTSILINLTRKLPLFIEYEIDFGMCDSAVYLLI